MVPCYPELRAERPSSKGPGKGYRDDRGKSRTSVNPFGAHWRGWCYGRQARTRRRRILAYQENRGFSKNSPALVPTVRRGNAYRSASRNRPRARNWGRLHCYGGGDTANAGGSPYLFSLRTVGQCDSLSRGSKLPTLCQRTCGVYSGREMCEHP
jgi:hypothetical protein